MTTSAKLPRRESLQAGRALVAVAAIGDSEVRAHRAASILARSGFDVCWEGSDPGELAACEDAPDIAVVSSEQLEGAKAWAQKLRERFPESDVVVVVSVAGRRAFREAIQEGLDGIVLESEVETCLPVAVDAVCSGQLVVPRELREHLTKPALSTREKQILGMVVMGFTNGEIAAKLFLAESTVKSHLSSAFVKMGVRSRNEATALILDAENGLGTGILAISEDPTTPDPLKN
jgi:DNA-binding NarL/FixJ family response regulator